MRCSLVELNRLKSINLRPAKECNRTILTLGLGPRSYIQAALYPANRRVPIEPTRKSRMANKREGFATRTATAAGYPLAAADKLTEDTACVACADMAQRTVQALHESQEELRRLSGLLVSSQEDERRRIALDLHDGLGQSISLIKLSIEKCAMLLAAGATHQAGESLQQLIPRVEEALVDVRRVSTELRPLILDDLGILPTLSWFFREFEATCGGIAVERAFNVAEHEIPVSLHITVYRIIQEAVHNIVKHSAASRVRVGLDSRGDELHLVIEDNGRGFDPDSVKCVEGQTRGLGLLSMKERASFSGGSYRLRSAAGQGTCIAVSWPAGSCPANLDCCRACESGGKQAPCQVLVRPAPTAAC